MGCDSSKPVLEHNGGYQPSGPSLNPDATHLEEQDEETRQRVKTNQYIDEQQALAKKQEDEKVKLLLLGTGESGKSTIFKQMRILWGAPKTDDDLRMYGVIVRSNIITAMRKLCILIRQLNYVQKLDDESAAATAADYSDCSGMTAREAYDQIIAYLVDNTSNQPFPDIPKDQAEQDWVGESRRAGVQSNKDARKFLQHVEAIRVLWQVRRHRKNLSVYFMWISIRKSGMKMARLVFGSSIHINLNALPATTKITSHRISPS